MQLLVDELLHVGTPVLFLLYWLLYVPKYGLQWKNVFPWMLFPFLYGVFVLIRGSLSGFYPYPFFEVPVLGAGRVAINTIGLILLFLAFALLLVGIGRGMGKKER